MATEESVLKTRVTLLQRLKDKRDEKSWAQFVASYRQYVYNITRRMQLNHHDAEDVVQRIMLKLWDKLPDLEYDSQKGRFRGWLSVVTANQVNDFYRQRKRGLPPPPGIEPEEMSYKERSFTPAEIDIIAENEWKTYLSNLAWEKIQDAFSAKVREAFLQMTKGKKAKEIAGTLGISENSVWVYNKRVKDRLKKEIRLLNNDLG